MYSPKTKTQKKEEAILKAREWARKRKGADDDVDVGVSPTKKKAAKQPGAAVEGEDVITNLPDIPAKKTSRRSAAGSDDVSDAESIGSRTRSRRRSVGTTTAAAAPKAAKRAASSSPKKSPRKTPAKSKKKVAAVEEQVVEAAAPEE